MNDCDAIREWLSAYLDGEITPRRREAIEAHLAGCDACRRELASLRGVSACLQAWPAPEANPELSARFAERLAERTRQPAARRPFAIPWVRTAWATGLAACLALGVFVFLHESPTTRSPIDSAAPIVTDAGDGLADLIDEKAGANEKTADTGPSVAYLPLDSNTARPEPPRDGRRHMATEPAPAMEKVTDEFSLESDEFILDPTLTAMNALTETPAVGGLPPESDDAAGEMVVLLSKDGVGGDVYLPVDESYEHQPEELVFALLAEL
jgi:hypothetical protein